MSAVEINRDWLWQFLGASMPAEGETVDIRGQAFIQRAGILRSIAVYSDQQKQTEQIFGFKWKKVDTFNSPNSLARMKAWLLSRYTDPAEAPWFAEHGDFPLVLDAGCGGGMSGLELFGPMANRIHYLGVDISEAVEVAAERFQAAQYNGAFIQADIANLPFEKESVDVIFSEGVLHHTDSTEHTLKNLAHLLRPGGRFMFYVYKKKGPIREFSDDLIRDRLQNMQPDEAWRAMEPLTRLGILLGELDAEIDIPDDIEILGIPAGKISVQRLFYWHVAKAFYSTDLTFDEMNHINFDWYAPKNAHRQTLEQVRQWCSEAGMTIEREVSEQAGITVVARKYI